MDLHQAAAQKGAEDRGLGTNCDVLQSPVGGACSHVIICGQHVIPGQDRRPETFNMVMKAAARPMIQINISEHYLSLVQDPPPKMTTEERLSQLEKVLQPQVASLTWEPWYRPTRLLAAPQVQVFQWWHSQGSLHHV